MFAIGALVMRGCKAVVVVVVVVGGGGGGGGEDNYGGPEGHLSFQLLSSAPPVAVLRPSSGCPLPLQ